jgi:hypothetical protein|tara:strand:+ start:250 stop:594 length:345 start_codon:yes stop_codon:yes gene_type:complete
MSFQEEKYEDVQIPLPEVFEKKIRPDKLPFRYLSRSQLPNHAGQLKSLYMRMQKIAIQLVIMLAKKQGRKLKLNDRRLSRVTKKQKKRKMSLKQKKAINLGRKKAGLTLIKWKK